jgi:hypothetical protein
MENKLLSFKEIAEMLGMNQRSVKAFLMKNQIPIHVLGHRTKRARKEDIDNFIKSTIHTPDTL